MLLKQGQKMALSGLLLAINQILIVMASFIDVSSLTLLAAAALVIGIAVYELGIRNGSLFFVASCILGAILSPMKLYMISYALMGMYVLIKEFLDRRYFQRWNRWLLLGCKVLIFDLYFTPLLILLPEVFLAPGEFDTMGVLIWLLVQVVVVLCDRVYDRVLLLYHQRIRKNIRRNGGGF